VFENNVPVTPESAWHETKYPRHKAEKVLTRVPLDPTQMKVHAALALARFDALLAVDTNTKEIGAARVSAAAPVMAERISEGHDLYQLEGFEFRGARFPPEHVAWYLAVKSLLNWPTHSPSRRIALIVDSDLGLIPELNARRAPILGGLVLPPEFEIVYASAEVRRESIANLLLAEADRGASAILDAVGRLSAGRGNLRPGDADDPFETFRCWLRRPDGSWDVDESE
jgi:hypothetical protein